MNERTAEQEQAIREHCSALGISDSDISDIILYDWGNWGEHYTWVMSATQAEITDWIRQAQR